MTPIPPATLAQDRDSKMHVLDRIEEDYPNALHNELHHFFTEIDVSTPNFGENEAVLLSTSGSMAVLHDHQGGG